MLYLEHGRSKNPSIKEREVANPKLKKDIRKAKLKKHFASTPCRIGQRKPSE
jgi:hypothetical protein